MPLVTVVLNVYDLSLANRFLFRFGIGAYHSGVEIEGVEYTFHGDPDRCRTGV